jgi:sarcosine oxidase subunit alpha
VESAKISLKQGEIVAGEVANFIGRTPYLERESDLQELRMMRKHSDFTFEPHIQAGHDHIERLFTDSVNSKVSPN